MEHLNINIDRETLKKGEHKKMPSMPLTTKHLKGHSRLSSNLDALTVASSAFTDRYNIEAERLDWTVPNLTI